MWDTSIQSRKIIAIKTFYPSTIIYVTNYLQNINYWSTQKGKFGISVTESQLVQYVEYLIDNIFIQVSDRVYKQVVGIPMGTDCAPLLANLFLFRYEYKFIKETLRNNPYKARKFNFM